MKLDFATMLPLVSKLGDFLKQAFEAYVHMKTLGADINPDVLAAVLDTRMADWKPKLNGRDVLDPETRKAAARFLAGIAFNASTGPKG
jgi:hypothetical protein